MFEITAKIYNGKILIKYEVLDLNTNRKKILSIEQVQGLAIAGSLTNAEFNEKTGTFKGINGHDLRTLPKKNERIRSSYDIKTNCFMGKELADLIQTNISDYRERYLINEVMKFLESPCNGKICALYGLRRTGKTVLMFHSIKRLIECDNMDSTVYITLTEKDTLAVLFKTLQKLVHGGKKYIFIDEITVLNGFIQSSALLADVYARMGIHIVIAGTDSFVLQLAGQNNLYDRMVKIHTTYIGYKEYEYLNPGIDILEYIRIGGVLPADIFYNHEKTKDYIETAISNNIINSILRANNRREHQRLLELNERGLLKKAIEQAIEASAEELTVNVISRTYENGDLGSAKQLMESVFDIDSVLDTEEVEEKIRYKLGIVKKTDTVITDEYVEELKQFLIDIGVIKMFTRYVNGKKRMVPLFVQPGLRYNQVVALINALCETDSFYNIPKAIRDTFKGKIIEDLEGSLIEHEVLLSSLINYGRNINIEVTQLNYKGKEIDMVIHDDNTADIYEVKRSKNMTEEQCKWLVNREINHHIETLWSCRIRNRVLLYLGEDGDKIINDIEICYMNINYFLKRTLERV